MLVDVTDSWKINCTENVRCKKKWEKYELYKNYKKRSSNIEGNGEYQRKKNVDKSLEKKKKKQYQSYNRPTEERVNTKGNKSEWEWQQYTSHYLLFYKPS